MRHPWSIPVLLALVALGGYAAGARPVEAQAPVFPFLPGETVHFSFQDGGSRTCRIEEMKGVFARCGTPSETPVARYGDPARRLEWVNVAEVEWIITTERR
jgi:hypothetical protein